MVGPFHPRTALFFRWYELVEMAARQELGASKHPMQGWGIILNPKVYIPTIAARPCSGI